MQPSLLEVFSTSQGGGTIVGAFAKALKEDDHRVEIDRVSVCMSTAMDDFVVELVGPAALQEAWAVGTYLRKVAPQQDVQVELHGNDALQGQALVLEAFPNLISLRTHSYTETVAVLSYLFTPNISGHRCPKLETISLAWSWTESFVSPGLLLGFLGNIGRLKEQRPEIGVRDADDNYYDAEMDTFLGLDFPLGDIQLL